MSNMIQFAVPGKHPPDKEADHRIANSLSAISGLVRMKASHANGEDIRQTLLDVAGRIEAVARLHRMLAHASRTAVPLRQFLRDVCAAMKTTVADGLVKITVSCADELTLPPQQALWLGLLIAELLSNSIKYAHPTGLPTIITLGCDREHDGSFTFWFEDDGIGLPENFDPTSGDSLGMKIVQSLSQQLCGQFEWQDIGIGLRFTCRFPAGMRAGGDGP
ncbi:sensor histidine kinase [Xanthobacteraceae bacterium Astr-EGSB]|uniref:sensor histidine kinase n=1 Tax=Astrobacterium formosum TaxID=3069710 RepID=UPI0027B6F414|nr:sensor histidine kinase [Xanthobacteraceae bacterium Astr-EGSB]